MLFGKDEDFLAFERVVEEALRTRRMRLCAYCLMSNHLSNGYRSSINRNRKPNWRRGVVASTAVAPSAIPIGSRSRPSD